MIGAILLTFAIVVFLVLFDWNWFRGPVGRFASARLNREVVITGDLRVHPWSFSPKAEAWASASPSPTGRPRPIPRARRPGRRWPRSIASRCRSSCCPC
jgi:hypothetical protein